MTTFAVTVTYGNRFHLLKQVIDSALAEGVAKVIVVDNNSVDESKNKLREYEKELNGKIKVLYLDDNYGSAGGFKRGLEEAYNDNECEYIWLLDDDNVPENGAYKKLQLAYEYLGSSEKNILVSFRDFNYNVIALERGKQVEYEPNSCMGSHLGVWLINKISKKRKKGINFPIIKSQVAPYGGLFLHKNVIRAVGLPNEEFFLYADDHDWTLRMTNMGFNLYLCSESKLKDVDWTWKRSTSKNPHYEPNASEFKIYYAVRNHIFLDKNFIDNRFIYFSNLSILILYNYLIHLFLIPKAATKRLKLILRAIRDGLNGRLGRTF